MRNLQILSELQGYPLHIKEMLTKQRIRELVRETGPDGFYVSFSGGKDSQVAVDFTAKVMSECGCDRLHVMHVNTSLEYKSTTSFCKPFCDLVSQRHGISVILDTEYPKMTFMDVLKKHGYPVIGKEVSKVVSEARRGLKNGDGSYSYRLDQLNGRKKAPDGRKSAYNFDKWKFLLDAPFRISEKCCKCTKKAPASAYEKRTGRVPLIATMAEESRLRTQSWIMHGCNAFDGKRPSSRPFSFWRQDDILGYIYREKLPMAKAYGHVLPVRGGLAGQCDIYDILGSRPEEEICKYCTTGCDRTGCIFCLFGINSDRERILRLKKIEPDRTDFVLGGGETDPEGYLVPNKEGLGYAKILDWFAKNGIDIPYLKSAA